MEGHDSPASRPKLNRLQKKFLGAVVATHNPHQGRPQESLDAIWIPFKFGPNCSDRGDMVPSTDATEV